jgi:catalase
MSWAQGNEEPHKAAPESMHMVMWIMSDRGIPRSFSTMEGFGVHSYRLVNPAGQSHFVKFHWKPILGVHSLVWDEAVKLAGQDPDFHRRDMFDSLEKGNMRTTINKGVFPMLQPRSMDTQSRKSDPSLVSSAIRRTDLGF